VRTPRSPSIQPPRDRRTRRQSRRRRNRQLPFAVGPRALQLIHLSHRPGLGRLEPRFFGTGKANPRDLCGLPKIFTFLEGSDLGGDEPLFTGAFAYRGRVDGGRIYDLSVGKPDPLGYFLTPNRAAADERVRREGYAGVRVGCPDGRQVILLFEALSVVSAGAAKNFLARGAGKARPRG